MRDAADQQTSRVGDKVRVLGVPPMWYNGIKPGEYDEATVVLERCVGRVYPVTAIDEYDHVVINCHDDGSPCDSWCHHTFYLEREFVEILPGGSKIEETGT